LPAFRKACHAAARALGVRVLKVEVPIAPTGTNYACVILELPGEPVAVVLNRHHPAVAFATPPSDKGGGRLRFVEASALSDLFRSFGGYAVLVASEAREPVDEESCRLLAPAELEQLRYWRPRCVGEVVFNHWD
jgi:hypothetical protein